MKTAYLLTMKETYNSPEKIIFLDQQKAVNNFKECILQAFKENNTDHDDNGYNFDQCLLAWEMSLDPYNVTLEEITIIE